MTRCAALPPSSMGSPLDAPHREATLLTSVSSKSATLPSVLYPVSAWTKAIPGFLPIAINQLTMAEHELKQVLSNLHSLKPTQLERAAPLLSRAKLALLRLNALVPTPSTSSAHLDLAREVFEVGALISIRLRDTEAFTRYFQQLQPFYALPSPRSRRHNNQSKITGLHLLLLLSLGDYAGFHTVLEGLENSQEGQEQVGKDEFVQYPVRLEQALMEGSYDKVWGETKGERVPSEEFEIFSDVSVRPVYRTVIRTGLSEDALLLTRVGPHQHHTLRDRLVLGAGVPVPPHRQRQELALPRFRGRCYSIRPITRLGGQRR